MENLEIGMIVKVNHPRLEGKKLKINKLNRQYAQVQIIGFAGIYTVPIQIIES
jgi:hypothetical protein